MEMEQQKEVLKWLLGQVGRAEQHKEELTDRLMRINAERKAPIGRAGYEPLPRTAEQQPSEGAASILFKLSEIEERIYDQKSEIEKSIVRVMDIIDFIPQNKVERRIFELRYIDCMEWYDVAEAIPLARSKCHEKHGATLEALLQYPKIKAMVEDAEEDFIAWEINTRSKNSSGGIRPKNKIGKRNRKKKRRR